MRRVVALIATSALVAGGVLTSGSRSDLRRHDRDRARRAAAPAIGPRRSQGRRRARGRLSLQRL